MTASRRLRRTAGLRRLVRETRLHPASLVLPVFVTEGEHVSHPIKSMPGVSQISVDQLNGLVTEVVAGGIGGLLFFGVPERKDAQGTGASDPSGPVARAIATARTQAPDLVLIADVCLCEYTDHGHCGLLDAHGDIDDAGTLEVLARAAVAYARAGADLVAPSAMMDGQVAAIRSALDDAGLRAVGIMSYAAKHASSLYGPFREAAQSAPRSGDRRAYQMDARNAREAMREMQADADEGADILMVKPAGAALDLIHAARERFDLPIAAYQVSGEYAMIKAASANGWLDERSVALETIGAIARAGAAVIITYYALDVARWLAEGDR